MGGCVCTRGGWVCTRGARIEGPFAERRVHTLIQASPKSNTGYTHHQWGGHTHQCGFSHTGGGCTHTGLWTMVQRRDENHQIGVKWLVLPPNMASFDPESPKNHCFTPFSAPKSAHGSTTRVPRLTLREPEGGAGGCKMVENTPEMAPYLISPK